MHRVVDSSISLLLPFNSLFSEKHRGFAFVEFELAEVSCFDIAVDYESKIFFLYSKPLDLHMNQGGSPFLPV